MAADPSTLVGKVVCGYQGWFLTPNDTGGVGWRHWSHNDKVCDGATLNFDLWPDMAEYTDTEETGLHYANGQPARLFSSLHQSTVFTHFAWMQQYNIDGAFLQRFVGEIKDPRFFLIRNNVTRHVMAAAEKYGRTFSIMWDISGVAESTLVADLKADWDFLVKELHVDRSSAYQRHEGKLVVTIWGLGITNRPGTVQQTIEIVKWLQAANCFVMGGVPFYWRDGTGDSKPGFMDAYRAFDAISPWSIGRYNSVADYENKFKVNVVKDKEATLSHNQWYAPVVFPGSSDANLRQRNANFNSIPRLGGAFFNGQANAVKERLRREKTFVYLAMFDEVDESTAIFKAATRKEDLPIDGKNLLHLNTDSPNSSLSNDHYLQLASELSTAMKTPTRDSLFSDGNDTLFDSTALRSESDAYRAMMQGDGNLVINALPDLEVVWQLGPAASRPRPFRLVMQADGNVVIYDGKNQPRFAASDTPRWAQQIQKSKGPYRLVMQNDKNLVAYDVNGLVVWAAL